MDAEIDHGNVTGRPEGCSEVVGKCQWRNILWRIDIVIKPIIMVYQFLKLRRELATRDRP